MFEPQKRTIVITQLTIHVGDPKTGTSSIQYALRKGLIDASPQRIAAWKQPNAVALAKVLRSGDSEKQAERYGEVHDWLTGCGTEHAVISSELFAGPGSTIHQQMPKTLHKALAAHVPEHAQSTRVVAYVRPHASRFLAAFIQRTKTGGIFYDVKTLFEATVKSDTLDYAERFGRWHAQFGDRFILRPFIRSELRNGDAVADFATTLLGETPFRITEDVEENVAVPLHSLAGMRVMHRRFKQVGVGRIGRKILGGAMANTFLPMGPVQGEKPMLDRATVEALIRAYAADAKRLDETFFSAPLMQESLEKSIDKTADHPIDLKPSLYFTQAKKQQLIAISEEIGRQVITPPNLWPRYHLIGRHEFKISAEEAEVLEKNRNRLEHIDTLMADLADILRG